MADELSFAVNKQCRMCEWLAICIKQCFTLFITSVGQRRCIECATGIIVQTSCVIYVVFPILEVTGLELIARVSERPGLRQRQFQETIKDVSVCNVLMHTAH